MSFSEIKSLRTDIPLRWYSQRQVIREAQGIQINRRNKVNNKTIPFIYYDV